MVPIKEALTFDDVTLAPKYSEILPSEVNTNTQLTKNLKLKIPLLSSAMDTVTESKMAIAIAKSGGIGVIHRNLDIKNQIQEIKKVKKQKLLVGAAVGAGPNEFKRAEEIIKEGVDLIVVDTAHGHTKKVGEIIRFIKKFKKNTYFKNIVEDINKVKRLKNKPHSQTVKKLGMACSYPGTFNSSIHSIINSSNYKGAILRTIKAGGCNCSRVNFIGAYFAALKGIESIPKSWIKRTDSAKKILNQN